MFDIGLRDWNVKISAHAGIMYMYIVELIFKTKYTYKRKLKKYSN